ncbi:hypothetical protein RISK_003570 [Rhodopirellula islandica]|uniref:Uncharacterized protein n=1 Tax=Rhodopirellula islandica TaxID=595434 RepID=A0A0J1BDE5_RHOIS|nr:hypothetical protein RISK_003570 [Rhodopirellula islandica]
MQRAATATGGDSAGLIAIIGASRTIGSKKSITGLRHEAAAPIFASKSRPRICGLSRLGLKSIGNGVRHP